MQGALYGLVGALFADFCQNHKQIREGKWGYICSLTLSTMFGLALGLLPLVDNFAHVFGLLCGYVCVGRKLGFLWDQWGKNHLNGLACHAVTFKHFV
jgi:membrane associated rhomboid family serine protease